MRQLAPSRINDSSIRVPGDKSIGHRAALLSILADGPIRVSNFPHVADCRSSLAAAQALGVRVENDGLDLVLTPPAEIRVDPDTVIDCGNSGTTARLVAGILSGLPVEATLTGDESLRRRPMKRVIDPLMRMGAEIAADDGRLPMRVRGSKLLPFEYRLPVASAQVKSALLLAGLASKCGVTVREDVVTRDHTEVMLGHLGEGLTVRHIKPVLVPDPVDPRKRRQEMPEPFKTEVLLAPRAAIHGGTVDVPGDISTAAFFFAAAAIAGKTITIQHVGVNPTRTGIIEHLRAIGCKVEVTDRQTVSGEPRGNVTVTGGKLGARRISDEATVALIDEIPIVAVMAAFASGTTVIRNAGELRVKESDRLAAVVDNLKRMGVKCGLLEDGLAVEGGGEFEGTDFQTFGDHRIAMAFSVAALFVNGPSNLDDAECVGISCPTFFDILDQIKA